MREGLGSLRDNSLVIFFVGRFFWVFCGFGGSLFRIWFLRKIFFVGSGGSWWGFRG